MKTKNKQQHAGGEVTELARETAKVEQYWLLTVGWGSAAIAAVTVRPCQEFGSTNCTYAGDCAIVFLPIGIA